MSYDAWKTRSPDDDLPQEPPQQWFVCDVCDGSGEVVKGEWGYEAGCTHRHWMEIGEPCRNCEGHGGWPGDVEADAP